MPVASTTHSPFLQRGLEQTSVMRRQSILATLVLVAGATTLLRAQAAVHPDVVTLSDDHRWNVLGATGNTRIRTPARAETNDNRLSAGVLRDGVLSLHLVAQEVTWYPEAEDGPTQVVEAFGEAGKAPSVPGPLIRIPLGTTIDATITNSLTDTLVVLGLRGRNDSLRIAPNGVEKLRYKPPTAGSFLYAGSDVRDGKTRFGGTRGQLVGGLIVDAGAPPKDRVFIATGWDPVPIAGNPYFLTMNGKSWPYTEKFVHTVGDTVRWRVLNGGAGTSAHHPMHLHGSTTASTPAVAGTLTPSIGPASSAGW
jgi:manganese oxidase